MKILSAPNAFKGALDSFDAAQVIKEGLEKSKLNAEITLFPIADGGDGTMQVLVKYFDGEFVSCGVSDPVGRPVEADFGLIDIGRTAVIELASASGIRHLSAAELNPMLASSYGTGLLIKEALGHNVNHIIITLGGSATVDAGIGILSALGLKINDLDAPALGGQVLRQIKSVDTSLLNDEVRDVRFTLLCDVDNYLLGDKGAAAVFGPQKGATQSMVKELESGLSHFAEITKQEIGIDVTELKHGGAAGGCGAFLSAYLNAEIVDGSEYLFDKMQLDRHLQTADLVITAEGRIDEQTRHGKGPYALANRALASGVPTIALSGQIAPELDISDYPAFNSIIPIGNGPMPLDDAMHLTAKNLGRTATQIGQLLSLKDA